MIPEGISVAAKSKVEVDSNSTCALGFLKSSVEMSQSRGNVPIEPQIISPTTDDLTRIKSNFTKIKQNLDPRYGLLDTLYEKDILDFKTRTEISSWSNSEDCCDKLLVHLIDSEHGTGESLSGFKEILSNDYSWIYNMIWGDPKDVSNENNRPLFKHEKRRITGNHRYLIKLIDPHKHDFLSLLLEKDCITLSHYEKLISFNKTEEMNSELLKIMMRRSFVHFLSFIECLKETLQYNLGQILETNKIALSMQVDLKNKKLEEQIASVLTGTVELDDLDLDEAGKKLVRDILKSLKEKRLVTVGGVFGSLTVYILLMSTEAVDELEMLYNTKELETSLRTITLSDVTIQIDDDEFIRCRRFFSGNNSENLTKRFRSIEDRLDLHCQLLNDMPLELFEMISKRTLWMMWVCVFFESLLPGSSMPINQYLERGAQGFSNFVKVSSKDIYSELSSVCILWQKMLRHKSYGESIRSELLSNIARSAINRSEEILIANLSVQDGLLDLSPDKTPTTNEKKQTFTKLLKFLVSLEEQCKGHLVNHVISYGVYWSNFEKKWPLDKKTKLLINAACQNDVIRSMNIDANVFSVRNNSKHTTTTGHIQASQNLVSCLFEQNCITFDQRNELNKPKDPEKNEKLMKLLEHGSIGMFEIVIEYLNSTKQNDVIDLLQPNQEIHKNGKHIVNCLSRATEILNMFKENNIESSLLDQFSIKDHTVYPDRLIRFQQNELVLNILECSQSDAYLFFLTFLLTKKQHVLLLPMIQGIPHSRLIEKFESYLIDAIDADTAFLLRLVDFNVINHTQMRTIESKRTSIGKNKELLRIISNVTPKSFCLFLTVLDQSGRSNIFKSMHLIQSEPEKPVAPPEDYNSGITGEQVEMVEETVQETQLIETRKFGETCTDVEDGQDISSYESDEFSQPIRYEEGLDIEYTLETKINFDLKLNPPSCITSRIIKKKALLLTDNELHNIVFLKIAIIRRPAIDLQSLSLLVSSLLGYRSNNLDRERMNTEMKLRIAVMKFSETLIQNVDPSEYSLQTLLAKSVLTPEQKAEVESMPNSEMRSEDLLRILFTTKHPEAFSVFMKTLKRDHVELVQMMTAYKAYNGVGKYSFLNNFNIWLMLVRIVRESRPNMNTEFKNHPNTIVHKQKQVLTRSMAVDF